MDFQTAVKSVLNNYSNFEGRACRSELWFWVLAIFVANIVLSIIDRSGVIGGLLMLGTLVPSIAVTARRLHDIDKSGWLQLLYIIPLVGLVLAIVWGTQKGTDGENQYGLDPLVLQQLKQ